MKARKLYYATLMDEFGKLYRVKTEAWCFDDAYVDFLNEVEKVNNFGMNAEIIEIHRKGYGWDEEA